MVLGNAPSLHFALHQNERASLLPRGSASPLWSRSLLPSLPFSPSVLRAPSCFCCSVPSSRSFWVLPSSSPIPWDTFPAPSNSLLLLGFLSCRAARLPTSGPWTSSFYPTKCDTKIKMTVLDFRVAQVWRAFASSPAFPPSLLYLLPMDAVEDSLDWWVDRWEGFGESFKAIPSLQSLETCSCAPLTGSVFVWTLWSWRPNIFLRLCSLAISLEWFARGRCITSTIVGTLLHCRICCGVRRFPIFWLEKGRSLHPRNRCCCCRSKSRITYIRQLLRHRCCFR